jgi:hypothetical protein
MEWLLLILGAILGFLFNFGFRALRNYAERALLKQLAVENSRNPLLENGINYWLVQLRVGRGNFLTKFLVRGKTRLSLIAFAIFKANKPDYGDISKADAFDVSNGWDRRQPVFHIRRNSVIPLAVAKSKMGELPYQLNGTLSEIPLNSSYDLSLSLKTYDDDKEIKLISDTINNFILEGIPQ